MSKGKVINDFCHDYLISLLFHQELMPCWWHRKKEVWGCHAVLQWSGLLGSRISHGPSQGSVHQLLSGIAASDNTAIPSTPQSNFQLRYFKLFGCCLMNTAWGGPCMLHICFGEGHSKRRCCVQGKTRCLGSRSWLCSFHEGPGALSFPAMCWWLV